MKPGTIEMLDGTVYEIDIDGNYILLMHPDHTLVLHGYDLADPENIEIYIGDNIDLAKRIDHTEEAKIFNAPNPVFYQLAAITKPLK